MVSAGDIRILIADDDPNNLKLLKNILQPQGYKLSLAKDGEELLNLTDKIKPDLILLDIVMPSLDGYEVCSVLKANPKTANIPVIFITGFDYNEDESKGFEVGAVDYITKPISASVVIARVKNHLNLYIKTKRYDELIEFLKNEGYNFLIKKFFDDGNK